MQQIVPAGYIDRVAFELMNEVLIANQLLVPPILTVQKHAAFPLEWTIRHMKLVALLDRSFRRFPPHFEVFPSRI